MRRAKTLTFRLRWAQAIENGRAAIETHLIAQAQRSMDPEAMDLPASDPRVTIAEAIRIAKMNQSARGGVSGGTGIDDDHEAMSEERIEELRQKLCRKVERLRQRFIRDDGWTKDPATGALIPPGFARVSE